MWMVLKHACATDTYIFQQLNVYKVLNQIRFGKWVFELMNAFQCGIVTFIALQILTTPKWSQWAMNHWLNIHSVDVGASVFQAIF